MAGVSLLAAVLRNQLARSQYKPRGGRAALWAMFLPIMKGREHGITQSVYLAETLEKLHYVLTQRLAELGPLSCWIKPSASLAKTTLMRRTGSGTASWVNAGVPGKLFAVFGDYIAPPRETFPIPTYGCRQWDRLSDIWR